MVTRIAVDKRTVAMSSGKMKLEWIIKFNSVTDSSATIAVDSVVVDVANVLVLIVAVVVGELLLEHRLRKILQARRLP